VCYRVLIVRRAIAPLMSNITLLHQNATHYDSTLVNIPRVLDQRVIMGTPSFASLHQPPSSIVALVFMPRGGGGTRLSSNIYTLSEVTLTLPSKQPLRNDLIQGI
jgi:hypothetical protein